jgi:hypothetical protein
MHLADEPSFTSLLSRWGAPAIVVAAVVIVMALSELADGLGVVKDAISHLLAYISPALYSKTAREDRRAKSRMARLLIANLDLLEHELHWQRETFTEIRVTMESPDIAPKTRSAFRRSRRSRRSYRTAPLVRTLRTQVGGITSLQGAPGAGKSVALRGYCRALLTEAERGGMRPRPLALYVSLRDLEVPPTLITGPALREYIASQANPRQSKELGEYFDSAFDDDIKAGRLVLLLDSFDEMPAILGTANIDRSILPYVEAINALMGGGRAQCIVASREYKGPRVPGWTSLYLIGMSYEEQIGLLRSYGVRLDDLVAVRPLLLDPRAGFSADLRNPLYLALLARYVVAHGRPPSRPSEMFEDYVLEQVSSEDPADIPVLLAALESFAVELSADNDTGLSADVEVLRRNLIRARPDMDLHEGQFLSERLLASKLLIETPATFRTTRRVAFVHRRVLEYFATRYVIEHPAEIPPAELIGRSRWRETAVAMLQVGNPADTVLLEAEIEAALRCELDAVKEAEQAGMDFAWNSTTVHLLELLVSAYGSDVRAMPSATSEVVSALVETGWQRGLIDDRKFALDCLPVIDPDLRERLVTSAFTGSSAWMRLSALRDCSSLHPLPEALNEAIRRLLITLMDAAQLRYEAAGIDSDLSRLYNGNALVRARKLLTYLPFLVVALAICTIAADFASGVFQVSSVWDIRFELIYSLLLPLAVFWLFQSSQPMSYRGSPSRIRRFFTRFMRVWNRKGDFSGTDGIWFMGMCLASFDLVGNLVYAIYELADRHFTYGFLVFATQSLAHPYVLLWGPSVLIAVATAGVGEQMRLRNTVKLPVEMFGDSSRDFLEAIRGSWPEIVGSMLVGYAIPVGTIYGIFYLLDHFAGHAGHYVVLSITILLTSILPLILLVEVLRHAVSRRRVRRQLRRDHDFSPAVFVQALQGLADATEAAEYVRLLRVVQPDQARKLPLEFVRKLAATLETSDDPVIVIGGLDPDPPQTITLSKQQTSGWRTGVLDEVGRLAEFLRER